MRTFGRITGALGLGLAALGSIGAVAMLPPPVVNNAGTFVEERRQALRQHLPEAPDLQEPVVGIPAAECVPAEFASQGEPTCAAEAPPGDPADLLTLSNEAARHFRAPAPAEAAPAQE